MDCFFFFSEPHWFHLQGGGENPDLLTSKMRSKEAVGIVALGYTHREEPGKDNSAQIASSMHPLKGDWKRPNCFQPYFIASMNLESLSSVMC